jgi:hypothetical protein
MSYNSLEQFVSKIVNINAPFTDGNRGVSAIYGGSFSLVTDITLQLKKQTISFAKAYKQCTFSNEEISNMAKKVEGSILNENILSILNKKEANSLIWDLHSLVDARVE